MSCLHTFNLIILSISYRQPHGCQSCRTLYQHPEPATLGQSASWDEFPASTSGPHQRFQRDLWEPAGTLRAGEVTCQEMLLFKISKCEAKNLKWDHSAPFAYVTPLTTNCNEMGADIGPSLTNDILTFSLTLTEVITTAQQWYIGAHSHILYLKK